MMKLGASVLLFLLTFVIITPFAQAHVVKEDDISTSGVVMHVTPDDDPIAGEISQIYFDIQNKDLNTTSYLYRLNITNQDGVSTQATTYILGDQSVASNYAFPSLGTYKLLLEAVPVYIETTNEAEIVEFKFEQKVSRGTDSLNQVSSKNLILYIAVIVVGTLTVVVVVMTVKRGNSKNRD